MAFKVTHLVHGVWPAVEFYLANDNKRLTKSPQNEDFDHRRSTVFLYRKSNSAPPPQAENPGEADWS